MDEHMNSEQPESNQRSRQPRWKQIAREYIQTLLSALVIYFIISVSVVKAYQIPSGSMENTTDKVFLCESKTS